MFFAYTGVPEVVCYKSKRKRNREIRGEKEEREKYRCRVVEVAGEGGWLQDMIELVYTGWL